MSKPVVGLPGVSYPLSNSSTVGRMRESFGAVRRFRRYTAERFPLAQFLPLSAVVALPAAVGTQVYAHLSPYSVPAALLSFGAVFLLLLRLRLVDELKDLEHDRRFYPDRPLPRGLVQPRQVGWAAAGVFLIEVVLATAGGVSALAFFALVGLYSVATSREFFCRQWLRSHFTVYVVSHELLIVPVCFYLYSLSGLTIDDVATPYFWALTAYIGYLLVLLEVARKLSPTRADVGCERHLHIPIRCGRQQPRGRLPCARNSDHRHSHVHDAAEADTPVLQFAGTAFLVPVAISPLGVHQTT